MQTRLPSRAQACTVRDGRCRRGPAWAATGRLRAALGARLGRQLEAQAADEGHHGGHQADLGQVLAQAVSGALGKRKVALGPASCAVCAQPQGLTLPARSGSLHAIHVLLCSWCRALWRFMELRSM